MKEGKSLIQLVAEIERQKAARKDFAVDTRKLRVEAGQPELKEYRVDAPPGPVVQTGVAPRFLFDEQDLTISEHTHGQVAEWTKVPKVYYDRMRTEAPDLWEANVNHWLETKRTSKGEPERRMVRSLDGNARAFLSTKYLRLDNDLIAAATLPIIAERGMEIVSTEVTERRLYIKAIDRSIQSFVGKPQRGDAMNFGFVISNSEIGVGSVSVKTFIERLRCVNGWVGEEHIRKLHMGADSMRGDVGEYLQDETVRTIEKAFAMQLTDVTRGVLTESYAEQVAARMTEATETEKPDKPIKATEVLAQQVGLLEGERDSVLQHVLTGGDLSKWGFANAVTRAAHDVESYDRATELEAIGMEVIDLGPAEWKEVVAAA